MLAGVEGHPPGQPGQLGGRAEQRPADRVAVRGQQQRRRLHPQALRHHRGTPVPAAVLGVPAARLLGGLAELGGVRVADPVGGGLAGGARHLAGHRAVRRGDQPAGDGRRVRGDREGAGQAVAPPAAAGAPAQVEVDPPQVGGGADGLGDVAREGQAEFGRRVGVAQADLLQRDGPAELAADRGGDQVRDGPLRDHALADPAGHRGLVVPQGQPALGAEVVDPAGQSGVADLGEGQERAEPFVRSSLADGHGGGGTSCGLVRGARAAPGRSCCT